jgi:hypothetical protein
MKNLLKLIKDNSKGLNFHVSDRKEDNDFSDLILKPIKADYK